MKLPASFQAQILTTTGSKSFQICEVLQELWSGYGQILRLELSGGSHPTIIAKHVTNPASSDHPRGWNSDLSHQRKVRSYQVETTWYQNYQTPLASNRCRTPKYLGASQENGQSLLLLEDLDAAGYPIRLTSVTPAQIQLCLQWLAEFHAAYLTETPKPPAGLWEIGTYWHLATRPEELAALSGRDDALQAAAPAIDKALTNARFQTLVHGDAKLANFCFSDHQLADHQLADHQLADHEDPAKQKVAALDFQYVGRGCGIKDLAYFLGSCLDESTLEHSESQLLDAYFNHLTASLTQKRSALDIPALITEWRALYPVACTDFHRFLKGWSPTHWKLTSHTERRAQKVIQHLTKGTSQTN